MLQLACFVGTSVRAFDGQCEGCLVRRTAYPPTHILFSIIIIVRKFLYDISNSLYLITARLSHTTHKSLLTRVVVRVGNDVHLQRVVVKVTHGIREIEALLPLTTGKIIKRKCLEKFRHLIRERLIQKLQEATCI